MEKCLTVIALALLTVVPAAAQDDDFGIWGEVNVEKKIDSRWDVDAGVEFRSRDNLKAADRWAFGADATFKITDWLKASAGYTLLDDHRQKANTSGRKTSDYWGVRHRFNVSLTGSYSFGDLNISLRERWQYTYRPEKTVDRYWTYTDEEEDRYEGEVADQHTYDAKSKNVWRNRLQLKYKVSKMWRPYLNAETHVSNGLEKVRYSAGTEIRLSKHHWLDLKYLFQKTYGDDDEEGDRHVLGIGYTYKF